MEPELEQRLTGTEEQIGKLYNDVATVRFHLLKTMVFMQEIVRDADPQDPKIQELRSLHESLFASTKL